MQDSIQNKVSEILTNNGLDFTIEKLPLVAQQSIMGIGDGGNLVEGIQDIKTPYFGLLNSKTGEIINTVKSGYTISQNSEIIEMVLRGIAPFGDVLSVHKAGSFNGGRKMFM